MNKKLLAIAVAGVLAAPLAQAQTANVTLYGRVNLDSEVIINAKQGNDSGVAGTGTPAPGSKQNLFRVTTNSSRVGIRGTESLGGGLNAIFQVESSINPAQSGGTWAGRESFVGLQGGWGTFKMGYFLSPYDDMHGIFGNVPTLLTGILATSAIWSNTGCAVACGSVGDGAFDNRIANSLRYDSPNMGGFTASVQAAGRQVGGDGGNLNQQRRHASIYSVNALYNNGPIQAGLAYEQHNALREGTVANPKLTDQGFTATGSYNFGPIKVGAVYERVQYDIGAGGDLKRDMWGVSGMGNLGPGQYYIAYFRANDGKGSSKCTTVAGITSCPRVGGVTLGESTGSQSWQVSYTYPLSKRTLMYTGYVMIDNDKNASYNFNVGNLAGLCYGNASNAAGSNVGCGDSARPQGLVAGLVHFF